MPARRPPPDEDPTAAADLDGDDDTGFDGDNDPTIEAATLNLTANASTAPDTSKPLPPPARTSPFSPPARTSPFAKAQAKAPEAPSGIQGLSTGFDF